MIQPNEITACIPSSRGKEAINTLLAVSNQRVKPIQIIVYDTATPGIKEDELTGWLCRYLGVDIIEGKSDTLFTARNYVVSLSRTRYVWLIDDDIVPWYNCLEEMINTYNTMEAEVVSSTQGKYINDVQKFTLGCENILFDKLVWDKAIKDYNGDNGEEYIAEQLVFNNSRAYVSSKAISIHLSEGSKRKPIDKDWICRNLTMLNKDDIEFLLRNWQNGD
jgi:hypothetical protein